MSVPSVNIFWFRRDLRLHDNAGLYYALKEKLPIVPIFIFDRNILDKLDNKEDRRISFIYESINNIQRQLLLLCSSLEIYYAYPGQVFQELFAKYKINKVFANHDYEPYGMDRDKGIKELSANSGVEFMTFKDHVIFEKNEIVKQDGSPYTVFTPYSRQWKASFSNDPLKSYPTEKYFFNFYKHKLQINFSFEAMGFKPTAGDFPSADPPETVIKSYAGQRNFPSIAGTSRLGVHLRFGTISIRKLAAKARELNDTFLNELIWRDFYQAILWHFPRVGQHKSFKPQYDSIEWRNNETEFDQWCKGQTGYPLVDAGMRELNATGFMHNRVRMTVASFLSKHLLIDWRWGEAYFAEKLLDYELASNNGGWQWAAGSGCDAAPYFRIFNPSLQAKKFDSELKYIKKWVQDLEEPFYPSPIVDHAFARKRCLEVYSRALKAFK